jgi:hypothetical protein
MIDSIVVVQNLLRDFAIAFAERVHRAFECLFRLAPQQENAIAQGAQFVVKMTVGIHKSPV